MPEQFNLQARHNTSALLAALSDMKFPYMAEGDYALLVKSQTFLATWFGQKEGES